MPAACASLRHPPARLAEKLPIQPGQQPGFFNALPPAKPPPPIAVRGVGNTGLYSAGAGMHAECPHACMHAWAGLKRALEQWP
jgi:hypothetical protein